MCFVYCVRPVYENHVSGLPRLCIFHLSIQYFIKLITHRHNCIDLLSKHNSLNNEYYQRLSHAKKCLIKIDKHDYFVHRSNLKQKEIPKMSKYQQTLQILAYLTYNVQNPHQYPPAPLRHLRLNKGTIEPYYT